MSECTQLKILKAFVFTESKLPFECFPPGRFILYENLTPVALRFIIWFLLSQEASNAMGSLNQTPLSLHRTKRNVRNP